MTINYYVCNHKLMKNRNNCMQPTVNKTPRIEVIDALRGFAVMAILLVHSLEHFIFPVYPTDSPEWLNILDNGTLNVVFSLFAGKSYAIFSDLHFISNATIKRRREKILAIAFFGG